MTNKPAPAKTNDQAIIQQLKALGMTDEYVPQKRRLIMSAEGLELTGKTHFALGGPEPIIFIDVDLGTEGVIHKFQQAGKRIMIHKVYVPKKAAKSDYEELWIKTKDIIRQAYSLSSGTMVWDTESEINELARLANFGKLTQVMPHHYAQVNRELRDIMDWAYDSSMSSIFLRKLKPKWVDGNRTKEYEGMGWGDMEYKCQVNITMHRLDGDDGPEFSATVRKCRQNPAITGTVLSGPTCNFDFLLSLVHGE